MTRPAALEVSGLVVRIGAHEILSEIDLSVAAGEVVALLGPSGSGKTTLLSAIAGFLTPASGEIRIGGEVVSSRERRVPPERRSIGFVFQSYALWPHLTARETVAFPLRAGGMGEEEAGHRADVLLGALGIAELSGRRPAELSGGQQQRVGVARALARDAGLYLLDEPTAHLDFTTRAAAEAEIATQRQGRGAAALYATHDPAEALALADRVALMRSGRIVQIGTPVEVYERPVDEWAAHLTGTASVVTAGAHHGILRIGEQAIPVEGAGDGEGRFVMRPEWVRLDGPAAGRVAAVRFRGAHTDVTLDTAVGEIAVRVPGALDLHRGDAVGWTVTRAWRLP